MEDFEAIYRQYYDPVYRYVFSLCRDEPLAEEITQETFFRAMEHLDKFQGRCKLSVWLCQIAKNTLFTYEKKQKRFEPESDADLGSEADLESELLDRDTAWTLHQLLHRLSEPYKEVFTLRVFEELPFSQIGELFGKSDSWARLIFFRAKKELRRNLDEAVM